jgi:hypothetical protein
MAMAAAFTSTTTASIVSYDFYFVRTSYLIIFVFGTILSIAILVLGLEDILPISLWVLFVYNFTFCNFFFFYKLYIIN